MSTKAYVLDAWAWIEYFRGTKSGSEVREHIEKKNEIITNTVTIAEVISKFEREGLDSDAAYQAIISLSKILAPMEAFAKSAGALHAEIKKTQPNFSLGDAFVLQSARSLGVKVLTGDPDFKNIKDVELL